MASRGVKICLVVSLLFLIIVTILIVALAFTIFKPKNPDITVHPLGLENLDISLLPNLTLNVSVGMLITIENPNYGSFEYTNSTGYVNFHDTVIAEVPIEADLVPARSQINVSTSADFMVAKLINDPNFWSDVMDGTLIFTSTATLPGKAHPPHVSFHGSLLPRSGWAPFSSQLVRYHRWVSVTVGHGFSW
ncbi:hypothetical protein Fmac_019407 [Flemingia macrophylla]|uniref:Late embryogenesis abundant protein LEA-2 subgroup domain-containing protein n=1 Tax=Flemingia macrophylla TaxID=520843 RepID=A0ABD1M7R2_9FABA